MAEKGYRALQTVNPNLKGILRVSRILFVSINYGLKSKKN